MAHYIYLYLFILIFVVIIRLNKAHTNCCIIWPREFSGTRDGKFCKLLFCSSLLDPTNVVGVPMINFIPAEPACI